MMMNKYQFDNILDGIGVDQFLADGGDVNFKRETGSTLLMDAVNRKNIKAIVTLINNGADVNLTTKTGTSPLMTCLITGDYWIACILLMAGASLCDKCLSYIAQYGDCSARYLIEFAKELPIKKHCYPNPLPKPNQGVMLEKGG